MHFSCCVEDTICDINDGIAGHSHDCNNSSEDLQEQRNLWLLQHFLESIRLDFFVSPKRRRDRSSFRSVRALHERALLVEEDMCCPSVERDRWNIIK